jgi:hypothetical protein
VAGWCTPVLYLRAPDGVVFPEYAADPQLEPARKQARVESEQQIETVRGAVTGIRAKTVSAGELVSRQTIGTVEAGGSVVGVDIDSI